VRRRKSQPSVDACRNLARVILVGAGSRNCDSRACREFDSRCKGYLGVSTRFASSCTDFVVADLAIFDLLDRPHAAGGFVICLANTRKLGPSGRNLDQYPDRLSNGWCWTMVWLNRIFTPHSRLFFGWRMVLAGSFAFSARSTCQMKSQP
jgi:hypothetical protein